MHFHTSSVFLLVNFVSVVIASAIPAVYRPWLGKRADVIIPVNGPNNPWGPLLRADAGQGDWMKGILDSTPLTMINMPGTHDTMTGSLTNATFDNNPFKTQLSPLSVQLNSGIRFIDIRCHHVKNELHIWHTFADTGKTFTDVLGDLRDFLTAHPSETVIMRVHNENDYTGDSNTNTRTYGETYDWYTNTNPDTVNIFGDHQFQGGSFNAWPNLGDARGKFIVLVDFDPTPFSKSQYGYTYANSGPLFDIEDAYQIQKDINEKWIAVTNHLTTVATAEDSVTLYVTYCSATSATTLPGDIMKFTPYRVAIQYDMVIGGYKGINQQLYPTMSARSGRLGVIIFDYPGQSLVDCVISKNTFPFTTSGICN